MSRIIYVLRDLVIGRLPLNFCRRAFYAMASSIWPCGNYSGIQTLDYRSKARANSCRTINKALALIEQNDTRRFKRVKREIRLIVNDRWLIKPLPERGIFYQAKVCSINLGRFDFSEHPKFRMAFLASSIVRCATLGYLRRKFPYPNRNQNKLPYEIRISAICRKEEIRTLLKLGYDLRGFDMNEKNRKDAQYVERWRDYFKELP